MEKMEEDKTLKIKKIRDNQGRERRGRISREHN